MRRSLSNIKIGISAGACLLFAFSLLVLPLRWILAALIAAIVHEAFHALAVYLCGGKLCTLVVGKEGAVMVASPMSCTRDFLCTMAGPLGSALMILTFPWMPRVAFCSAVHCMYNLLPIYPLDGGRALRCMIGRLSYVQQHKVCRCTENICFGLLFAAAAYLAFWKDLGLTPLILTLILLIRTKSANPPCKKGNLALQ